MDIPATATPIVCDMTSASDTVPERLSEYQRLFSQALIGRERTAGGIRFRFLAQHGVEPWVRDLAAREKACCAFFSFSVTTAGQEVHWDATVVDDEIARGILEEFYALPDTVAEGPGGVHARFSQRGLQFTSSPDGSVHQVRQAAASTGSPAPPAAPPEK